MPQSFVLVDFTVRSVLTMRIQYLIPLFATHSSIAYLDLQLKAIGVNLICFF